MKNKILIQITLGLIGIFLYNACDYISPPYTQGTHSGPDTSIVMRKILIEDYTGHTCPNCPRAAEMLDTLISIYGSQIVPIALHVSDYARPEIHPDSSYNKDYRTVTGTDWDNEFQVSLVGLPHGLVSRLDHGTSSFIKSYSEWSTASASIASLAADVKLTIQNSYNTSTRVITSTVNSEFVNSLTGTYMLTIVLTEDSIIDWQKDGITSPPTNLQFFVHKHMLRGSLNGSWGDTVATGDIAKGALWTRPYTYTLPTNFNDTHCKIVAFIYNSATYEVIQAEFKGIR